MKALRNHALQEALLFLILSAALIWYSLQGNAGSFTKDWNQSPYLSTIIIGGLIGVMGLLTLVSALLQLRKPADEKQAAEKKKPDLSGILRVLGLLGLSGAYYAALALIRLPYMALRLGDVTLRFSTFELTTLFFVAALMYFMGVRSKKLLTLVPLGTTVFLSVIFRSLLHVLLP